ncbi:sel1 repeat family protein [Sphingobium sp. PAMC28499]|nr:sel1 repeat family protein [Sphingobium sp. PAMC28499]
MTMLTFEEIKSWSEEEARERLASSDTDVANILRVAAEAGIADAQALYGQMNLDGKGIERDEAEALRWFSQAAKAGHPMAMNMIGRCCEFGWGTTIDKSLAAQWYDAAARLGLDWGMYNLATLYCLGEGVSVDRKEAYRLFEAAAKLGHAKSVNMLGGFYEDGWVVEKDMEIAASLYRQAAEAGDFRGEFNHARMLIAQARWAEAQAWIAKIPGTATDMFVEKVRQWLAHHPEPLVRPLAKVLCGKPG